MSLAAASVEAAYLVACRAELEAVKPGNVHGSGTAHGMTAEDFRRSAAVSAPAIARAGSSVGARILGAIEATRGVVSCNTNLGIVLLCAPLAAAAQSVDDADLRARLSAGLKQLEIADAALAYQAIRLAQPAGLGASPRHDVQLEPTVTLRQAMVEARDRDRIARQYATDFADIFELGLAALRNAASKADETWAVTMTYMAFLSRFPDSHIARKFGASVAETVRDEAAALEQRLHAGLTSRSARRALMDFDAALKARGLNPGTSADLTVASLFAYDLEARLCAACQRN